jgi:hypothetical protein
VERSVLIVSNTYTNILFFRLVVSPEDAFECSVLKRLYVFVTVAPHRRYPYFDVVVGLVRSFDPEICAGCSEGTCTPFHASQVKGDDPDKKGYPGSPGWGWDVRLISSSHKNKFV